MTVDQKLIEECIKKNRKAQSELYKNCYGYVISICRRYYKNEDDAESILNQAFLKVFNNIKKYKKETPFKSWLRKITVNTIIDEFRKSKIEKNAMSDPANQETEMQDHLVTLNEGDLRMDAEDIFLLLDRLPDVSRKVFCLYAIDGFPHKEIAEQLNITVGTSKWHVNNARIKMMQLIKEERMEYTKAV